MNYFKSRKLFFSLALIGILVLLIFVTLTKNQLLSEENAKLNVEEFNFYNHYLTTGNFIVYLILLFIANFMFIKVRYWDTFIWAGVIFLTFTLIDWFWLSEMVFHYRKSNTLWLGESNLRPFVGILIALAGLVVAILNYVLLKKIFTEKKNESDKPNKLTPDNKKSLTKEK